MMRSSLSKEVIATFLSRINQLKFPLDASALFYQKARTIWRRNPAFPNQSLCAVFTSSLVISEAPSLAISYHKHSELRLWANRKYGFFHEERVWIEAVQLWDQDWLRKTSLPTTGRPNSVATSVYNSNDKNPSGYSSVRLPGSVYFPRIWWQSRKIMFILAATAVYWIILCFRRVWL